MKKHCICVDLMGEHYILSIHSTEIEATIIAKKVFQMGSPPEVFAIPELVQICRLLKCETIDESWMNQSKFFESNGIFSVGVIEGPIE